VSHPLIAGLRSTDAGERRAACLDAPSDPSAVLLLEALGIALGDPERSVADAASRAIAAIAAAGADVSATLREALRSRDPQRRFRAALASARSELPDRKLLPALVDALDFEAPADRWAAARVMVEIGRANDEVRRLLLGLLRSDPRARLRAMAIHALHELAPDDPEARELALAATSDSDAELRRAAQIALRARGESPSART
jgi:HEAT repeat protein